ncbi:MAG: PIN domain-containing protein [Candidatus Nitrosocaldus sp.]
MIYADTDFFLALLKPNDRLRDSAVMLYEQHKGQITTSLITFIELMLLAKRYSLDPVRLTSSVMSICNIDDGRLLKAAIFIRDGVGVFDAFHAAYCNCKIISSDDVYDELGIERVRLASDA